MYLYMYMKDASHILVASLDSLRRWVLIINVLLGFTFMERHVANSGEVHVMYMYVHVHDKINASINNTCSTKYFSKKDLKKTFLLPFSIHMFALKV